MPGGEGGEVAFREGFATGGEGAPEFACDGGEVGGAFAQGGDGELDGGEAPVEVGAEAAFAREGGEVAVGGGDDADVHGDFAGAAEGLDAAFLEDAEEDALDVRGELGDFVEEEGSAVGFAEEPRAVGVGAGEGAADVAEEAAFEEVAGDGGAVEGEEGSGAAGLDVELLGDGFLADAAFAGDEHPHGAAAGDASDVLAEAAHGRAFGHEPPIAERAVGGDQAPGRRVPSRRFPGRREVAREAFQRLESAGVGEGPLRRADAFPPRFRGAAGDSGVEGEQVVGRDADFADGRLGEVLALGADARFDEPPHVFGQPRREVEAVGAQPRDVRAGPARRLEGLAQARGGGRQAHAEQQDAAEPLAVGPIFQHVGQHLAAGERQFRLRVAPQRRRRRQQVVLQVSETRHDQNPSSVFHAFLSSRNPVRPSSSMWSKTDQSDWFSTTLPAPGEGEGWTRQGRPSQRGAGGEGGASGASPFFAWRK